MRERKKKKEHNNIRLQDRRTAPDKRGDDGRGLDVYIAVREKVVRKWLFHG